MSRSGKLLDEIGDGAMSPFAIAAHELKSPLALVRQLSLALASDDLSSEEQAEIAHHLRLVSERALRFTSDLTKSYQLKDSLFDTEPVHARQLCEDVVQEITPLYKACDKEIIVTGRQLPLLAVAHRDFLRRILLNYADNALHYSDAGNPVEVSVSSIQRGERVRFSVRDHGPALPTDVWSSATATRPEQIHARPESSGLGLSIARLFAEAMGGEVGVTRHHDGSSFHVDLHASRQLSLV